jgi:hypothetical protein
MGTWGTAIKNNDAFADIYSEFFDLYNKGGLPDIISKKLLTTTGKFLKLKKKKTVCGF